MKKIIVCLILLLTLNIDASSGTLKQNSIIECNGEYYGNHGNPLHWHKAQLKNDKWVSLGEEVEVPACYIKPLNQKEEVKFSKCVDGDTAKFIVNNQEKTVRFLAIDTPETEHPEKGNEPFGKEASNYTCDSLTKAKKIMLEYDANSEKEDKYGRILAFVFVDDELLESKLISLGYAKVAYLYGDYNYVDELKEQEQIAQSKKIGIWSEENHADKIEIKEDNGNSVWEIIIDIIKVIFSFIDKVFDLL